VKFVPKITNFGDFGGWKHILRVTTDNGEIWREGTDLGHPTLRLFCKNRSRGFVP